jgi:hypothetical protein
MHIKSASFFRLNFGFCCRAASPRGINARCPLPCPDHPLALIHPAKRPQQAEEKQPSMSLLPAENLTLACYYGGGAGGLPLALNAAAIPPGFYSPNVTDLTSPQQAPVLCPASVPCALNRTGGEVCWVGVCGFPASSPGRHPAVGASCAAAPDSRPARAAWPAAALSLPRGVKALAAPSSWHPELTRWTATTTSRHATHAHARGSRKGVTSR